MANYYVSTRTQLEAIANDKTATAVYYLENDIDLSDANWVQITGTFNGILDGQGHKITGLKMTNTTTSNVGFFYYLGSTAVVRNITFDVNITGLDSVGCIAVTGYGGSLVENVRVTGSVTATGSNAGGMVNGGACKFQMCHSGVNVTTASNYAGGFMGFTGGNIQFVDCYSSGVISGGSYWGGFVGNAYMEAPPYPSFTHCYSVAESTAAFIDRDWGGINTTLTDCFYDSTKSAKACGTPARYDGSKTTAQMKMQTTFTNWDFSTVWGISPSVNNGFPYLVIFEGAAATPVNIASLMVSATGKATVPNWSLSPIPPTLSASVTGASISLDVRW